MPGFHRRTTVLTLAVLLSVPAADAGCATGSQSSLPGPTPAVPATSPCSSGLERDPTSGAEFDGPLGDRWDVYDHRSRFRDAPEGSDVGRFSDEVAYRRDMAAVHDGMLSLTIADERADVDGDGRPNWPGGGVQSRFDAPGATADRASCVEVRTRGFAANVAKDDAWDQNVYSAAWLQTRPPSYPGNPNPEIDIQEFFVDHAQHAALHTWTSPPPPAPAVPTDHVQVDNCRTGRPDTKPDAPGAVDDCAEGLDLGDLTTDFHTFSLRREVTTIDGRRTGLLTFYTDGRTTWRREFPADSPFVVAPRNIVLTTQGNPPGGPKGTFPKVALYDWVRTYH